MVLLFENHASECLVDPVGPLVEAFMQLFAVIEHLVSVEGHDRLRARMAQYEGKHSHLEEFFLRVALDHLFHRVVASHGGLVILVNHRVPRARSSITIPILRSSIRHGANEGLRPFLTDPSREEIVFVSQRNVDALEGRSTS